MLKGCCQFDFTPYILKNSPQTGFYEAEPEVPISQIMAHLIQKKQITE